MAWTVPTDYDEAVAWFRARLDLTDEEFEAIDSEARRKAFTIADVAQVDIIDQVWQALERAIRDGTTLEVFAAEIGGLLSAAWGRDDPHRIETIFRTNVQKAYNRGRWKQQHDPVVARLRPYYAYDALLDTRTSDICFELNKTVLPLEDPFWSSHLPPMHHRCRSSLRNLTQKQAERRGISETRPEVEIPEGFGEAPDIETDFQPDLDKYPPELADEFERKRSN